MYQLQVKAVVVATQFPQADGWRVTVDIDAMERGLGGQSVEKQEAAQFFEKQLRERGVTFGAHPTFRRADIVAEHPTRGIMVVEVEGRSSRQREQAVYSALGQTLLLMRRFDASIGYAIAVPDSEDWVRQLRKVPGVVTSRLNLKLWAVSEQAVREIVPE
jgi:hypothetical protein